MSHLVKRPKRLIFPILYLMQVRNQRFLTAVKPFVSNYSSHINLSTVAGNRNFLLRTDQFRLILSRNKSKARKITSKYGEEDSSDEEDELEDEEDDDLDYKEKNIKIYNVQSLRTDSILKTVFNISRKKVEASFYANKIRVNGNILTKKSRNVDVDDVIDLIIGVAKNTSNHLIVNRLQILKINSNPDNNSMIVKVLREKSLIINNYVGESSFRELEEENL